MLAPFDVFIQTTLKLEGGYVNNPADTGGETIFGITKAVARENGYTGAMRLMTRTAAIQIYKKKYWDSLALDSIAQISPEVALELADIGVNMGVDRAGEFLQRLLNVLNKNGALYPDLKIDGKIGQATIRAFKLFMVHRSTSGRIVIKRGLNCLKGAFYISLAERRQKDEAFIFGWLLNRIT